MGVVSRRERGCKKEVRCVTHVYEISTMKVVTEYHKYVVINKFLKRKETNLHHDFLASKNHSILSMVCLSSQKPLNNSLTIKAFDGIPMSPGIQRHLILHY